MMIDFNKLVDCDISLYLRGNDEEFKRTVNLSESEVFVLYHFESDRLTFINVDEIVAFAISARDYAHVREH